MKVLRWIKAAPGRFISYAIAALFSRDLTPGDVIDDDEDRGG